MKFTHRTLSAAMLAAFIAPAAQAEVALDVIANSDISFEGLVQSDANWYDNDIADLNAGTPTGNGGDGKNSEFEMRRAEIVLKGKGPGNFEWVLGYDAKANKYLDNNIKYKLGGNTYLQAGQFKQPNSLEELSSTKNNDYIAKAAITNTFGVARRLGAAYSIGDANWSLTGSVFGRELTRNLAHGSGFGARGTWAPINEKGNILHLGLSYVDYDTSRDSTRLRARPDADLATVRLVDTGDIKNTDRISTGGLESFWVTGPFKLQGEWMRTNVKRYGAGADNFSGTGGYISGVYNITGETWGYKGGVPTTPLPNAPASGMWQVGLRYDTIDLDDGSVRPGATPGASPLLTGVLGGQMDTLTLGVNWYWRSNFKVALNYVKVDSSRYIGKSGGSYSEDPANNNRVFNRVVDDSPNILEARVQFYW